MGVKEIKREDLPAMRGLAVVELYKPGCSPCEGLKPVMDELSRDSAYSEKIEFYVSNFISGGVGEEFGLNPQNVPILVLLKDGKMLQHFPGAKYAHGQASERVSADAGYLKKKLDRFLEQYPMQRTYSPSPSSAQATSIQAQPAQASPAVGGLETHLGLSENAMITLRERYLRKDESKNIIENPETMFMRVADNIAQAERFYGKSDADVDKTRRVFYEMMTGLDFLPNSPTLMNAGRDLQQLSACFVLPIEDSIKGIFETAMRGALVHKSGGGTGYSFSRIRPANSRVQSSSGIASGPVSFMYVFNVYTEAVKQGSTRRGANMGILRVDHPDIRNFVHAKGESNDTTSEILKKVKEKLDLDDDDPYIAVLKKTLLEKTQLNNFNISVGLTKEFMSALESDTYFNLKDPRTNAPVKKERAKELLEEIVDQAWKTGDPGIVFLDRINEHNPTPHIGEIESTNPCGEQPLLPYESCNLGSINLSRFVTPDRKIDYERLRAVIHNAVHFLDNVVDMNRYPLPEIEKMTKANRKIGLGVMGFADLITKMRIPYGSDESFVIAEDIMKFMTDEARKASAELAKERGVFDNWKGSIYDPESENFKGVELKLRNATVTTNAPTGTLAMIADCEYGIEPPFSLAYSKTVMDGKTLIYRFRGLDQVIKEEGFDADGIFRDLSEGKRDKFEALPESIKRLAVTAMKLSSEQHIRMQAAFQKYTDNAVSKTINMPSEATRADVMHAYILAHKLGCKGITIYRDKSKDVQVLEERLGDEILFSPDKPYKPLPKERIGIIRQEKVGDDKTVFAITGFWETPETQRMIEQLRKKGKPTETFVDSNFFDPRTHGLITALAIRVSKDLRKGIPLDEIVDDLKNLPATDEVGYDPGFEPGGEYVNRSITDAMWKALSGWRPPKTQSAQKQIKAYNKKEEPAKVSPENKEESEAKNPNNYGFCSKCHKYAVVPRDGCDKCTNCGYSSKGCPS